MNAGDRVKISTNEDTFEGTIIPRPDLLDEKTIVLKLDSGYNIGIKKENIKSKEVLKPYSKTEIQKQDLKFNPKLPTVAILSLGGTISSKIDYKTGGVVADYDAHDFVEMCPELESVANIKAERIMQVMTEDVDLETISKISKSLKPWLENKDITGLVVTLGTDMLHYISSALSFMITSNKPIVFTASQRSIDRGSSDAFMNLSCAVKAAAEWKGTEVITCMHESSDDKSCILINGTKVRKMHTSRRDAFRPINTLPYARITYPDLQVEELKKPFIKNKKLEIKKDISKDVALVNVYPGMDPEIIDFYVNKGYKGLVIAGTALGHVPTAGASNILPNLENALKKGIVVAIATQTLYGRTHPYVYTNLRKLSVQLGCVFAEDMLPETAYMKLAWLIANEKDNKKIVEKFRTNLKGEINPILEEENFLY